MIGRQMDAIRFSAGSVCLLWRQRNGELLRPTLALIEGIAVTREALLRRYFAMTLIEMLVVLVLIGLLAGSAVVALEGRQGEHALRVAADDLATAIRLASGQSVISLRPHRVVFDSSRAAYRVEQLVTGTALAFEPVRGRAGDWKTLPGGIRFEGLERRHASVIETEVAPILEFRSEENGFQGTVVLMHERGRIARVHVTGKAGEVHIERP